MRRREKRNDSRAATAATSSITVAPIREAATGHRPWPGGTCANNPAGRLRGTDLNRNYPGFWGGNGAGADYIDDTYRGDGPGSEPESDNLRRLISERQVTNLPEGLGAGVPVFSMDGRWLAFTASRGGLEPEDLPWNGPMVRSMENVSRERRLGVVATQGGDVSRILSSAFVASVKGTSPKTEVRLE